MKLVHLATAALALLAVPVASAHAGTDDYIGEVFTTAFAFCPTGSLPANGQILPIVQNQALYALIGATYGGDGRTNFALPTVLPVKTASGAPLTACIATTGPFPQRDGRRAKTSHPKQP